METIHRDGEVERLTGAMREPTLGVNICAISGPGGVGKTFLVEHVVEKLNLAGSGWLRLSADGLATQLRGDFVGTLEKRLAPITLPSQAIPGRDPFPQTRQVLELHRALATNATKQIASSPVGPEAKRLAEALLKAGHVLNSAIPKSKEYLDFKAISVDVKSIESKFDEAWELVRGLSAVAAREAPKLPVWLRRTLGFARRDRVQNDFFQLVAESYANDLRALISPTQDLASDQSAYRALCFFIDDFEVLGPTLSWFLFGNLLPQLEGARFPVLFVIAGRDDFAASDPDWHFKYQKYLRQQIRLTPFGPEQAMAFLTDAGLSEKEAQETYRQTGGFPFLLRLAVDERAAESNSSETSEGWGGGLLPPVLRSHESVDEQYGNSMA